MNLRQISYSLIGSLMLYSAASCTNKEYKNNAKARAAEYLNGYEVLKAERFAEQQLNDDQTSAKEVNYWDSLIIDAKSKEAYTKGQQMIRDSAQNKSYEKMEYKPKLDTIFPYNLLYNLKEEYSHYTDAKMFLKARENTPTKENYFDNELAYTVHYWNMLYAAGKQQEAYNKGAADERERIKNSQQ